MNMKRGATMEKKFYTFKKYEENREKERAKNAAASKGPLNASEVLAIGVFLLVSAALIFLIFKVGVLWTALISLVVFIITFFIHAKVERKKAERAAEMEKCLNEEPEELE